MAKSPPYKATRRLEGQRFGMLVFREMLGRVGHGREWICVCDCGNRVRVRQDNVTGGKQVSCGCRMDKVRKTFGKRASAIGLRAQGKKPYQDDPELPLDDRHLLPTADEVETFL